MASNWFWDGLTAWNKALDQGYKNSTLRGNNVDRQIKLINKLDAEHDQARGIEPGFWTNPNQKINIPKINTSDQAFTRTLNEAKGVNNKNNRSIAVVNANASAAKVNNTAENILKGTGSLYDSKGEKRQLGVGWGEPGSIPNIPEKGRTRWVGVNSEWRDRYGRVIAPHKDSIPNNTADEVNRVNTKGTSSNLDPNKLISEGGSKKGPWMTLPDGSINPEWQKLYPQSIEAKIDLIDQGLKINQRGELVPWYQGKPGSRISFDEGTALEAWQARELAKIPENTSAGGVTTAKRMQGAGEAMSGALVNMMIAKLAEPDEGDKGVPYARIDIDDEYNPYGTVA